MPYVHMREFMEASHEVGHTEPMDVVVYPHAFIGSLLLQSFSTLQLSAISTESPDREKLATKVAPARNWFNYRQAYLFDCQDSLEDYSLKERESREAILLAHYDQQSSIEDELLDSNPFYLEFFTALESDRHRLALEHKMLIEPIQFETKAAALFLSGVIQEKLIAVGQIQDDDSLYYWSSIEGHPDGDAFSLWQQTNKARRLSSLKTFTPTKEIPILTGANKPRPSGIYNIQQSGCLVDTHIRGENGETSLDTLMALELAEVIAADR